MTQLLPAISTGFTAFTATNLDDVVILLLFFSQVNHVLKRKHIVAGQYLGFAILVLASLPSFFGSLLLPQPWIGMLGILPIAIGINRFLNPDGDDENPSLAVQSEKFWYTSFLSPQTYSVAAITFANGGDNIGIYVPLFANCTLESLIAILGVFFSLVGVWCYMAFRLTQVPAIASSLTRYGNQLVPFVLIGLGILILNDSGILENRGLAVLSLVISGCCLISAYRNATAAIEVSPIPED